MIPKLPKLTGNLLRAGHALAGFTRDDLADRAGLSRDVLRSWEVSSAAIVPAQYQMHCRAIEALEGEGARFSGDGVSILSGDSPLSNGSGTSRHQLRTIARVYISVWIWLLGVRHAGVSHARHEQESQSARVLQWFAARLPSDEHFHSFSAR